VVNRRLEHNKPHEHGVVLSNPDNAGELAGTWFWAATPDLARESFERMRAGVSEWSGHRVKLDLVQHGEVVETAESPGS
jgi:hypothetical protein